MEEQKRKLTQGSTTGGVSTELDVRGFRKMTPQQQVKLDYKPAEPKEETLEYRGGNDLTVYFDTLIQAPRQFSSEVQLIFVLQRNGVVLPDMKPRIIKMKGI